jgi:hypothetical protein
MGGVGIYVQLYTSELVVMGIVYLDACCIVGYALNALILHIQTTMKGKVPVTADQKKLLGIPDKCTP